MSEIVKHETAISIGKDKIANNDFFKDLTELLEEEKFKVFFDKYMSNWLDIKCSITYMHLYRQFKIKYQELNNEELDKNIFKNKSVISRYHGHKNKENVSEIFLLKS